MAVNKITKHLIYTDYSVALASAGRTVNLNASKSGYHTISANFNTTDSLYYLTVTDGIYPILSINSNGDVQLMGMNKSLQTNRTISVRVAYIKA